jgi:glycosyltransferase involved in cell wall biosynthesis
VVANSQSDLPFVLNILYEHYLKRATRIVAQCDDQLPLLNPKCAPFTTVIGNPLNADFNDVPIVSKTTISKFVAVGRLSSQKNYHLMIAAFYYASLVHPSISLDIYGQGEEQNSLQNFIAKLGLQDKVILRGVSDNIAEVYKSSDCYLLSSNYEGLPNALMEAMASGLPVIATDCPTGPASLINSRGNGILTNVNDEKEFANAMIDYIENPTMGNEFGKAGQKYILENYHVDIIVYKHLQLVKEIMDDKQKSDLD